MNAGLDLEMPGPARWRGVQADLAVSSRKVTRETLDARARNVLNLVKRCIAIEGVSPVETTRNTPEDRLLNRRLAAESVVLLKNNNNVLPIPVDIDEIALIGPNMKNGAYCGGGSAQLESYYTVTNYQGIVDRLKQNTQGKAKIHYAIGSHGRGFLPLLGDSVKSPDGKPGKLRVRFFNQPPSVPDREVIDELELRESTWQFMGYTHPRLGTYFWADIEGTYRTPESGEYHWGIACCGTANLFVDDELLIDNTTDQKPGNTFFGRGTIEEKTIIKMKAGKNYHIRLQFGSLPTSKIYREGVVAYGPGAGRIGVAPVVNEDEIIGTAVKLAKKCKYTVVCVGLDVSCSVGSIRYAHMLINPFVAERIGKRGL